ncbi:MAG: isochorismatase family protein [Roseomonas sp.]|nr:isochorismatase family protein [Roseomonas sp.]MCA3306935.1 isochorismatase family protein [Roseomonas sp.]MCA3309800.1 isochorismatase family protein [Roseomonas sp.]MCA3319754.1 isochorismatase family protein [Roseomonas sp.]
MLVSREDNYTGVFDGKVGYGRNPAVVVIDFTLAYTTPGSPFFAEGVVRAVADTVPLLQAARAAGIPVIHTKVMYHPSGADGGWFVRKVPALRKLVPGEPLAEIDPKVAPLAEEVVIVKQYPSPFFGTPLAPMLATLGVDTLILAGCSTSGCVRAGALDGVQHGYRVIVPRECVGDRHDGPHDANLFDINAKYGDVVGREEVIQYLANLAKRND